MLNSDTLVQKRNDAINFRDVSFMLVGRHARPSKILSKSVLTNLQRDGCLPIFLKQLDIFLRRLRFSTQQAGK